MPFSAYAESTISPLPCTARYRQEIAYPLHPKQIGTSPKKALFAWRIHRWWGLLERTAIVADAQGNAALRVSYPKGSINPGNKNAPRGGAGFYATGGFPTQSPPEAACLHYQMHIPKNFLFGRGGKLPGLYGGEAPSGCREGAELRGFSTRYMWREDGKGTIYAYLPGKEEACGALIGLGNWTFSPGNSYRLEQEIILNHPGSTDGVLRVWINGTPVVDRADMEFRRTGNIAISGVMFSTFFGGKDESWASPTDQHLDFSDFSVFLP